MNWKQAFADAPSTALLILGTLAKSKGHQVEVMHLDIEQEGFVSEFNKFKPDILGITVNTFQVKSAREIAQFTKEANDIDNLEELAEMMVEVLNADKTEMAKLGMRKLLMLIKELMGTINEEIEGKNVPKAAVTK